MARTLPGARLTFVGAVLLAEMTWARGEGPKVTTADGQLEGVETHLSVEFLGIPYALPPTQDRRWRPPVQNARWEGVRLARAFSPSCWQMGDSDIAQDEDCLYLNVYAPKSALASSSKLPVLVWIHGGCSTDGTAMSTRWNGTRIIHRNANVVVVAMNYRRASPPPPPLLTQPPVFCGDFLFEG